MKSNSPFQCLALLATVLAVGTWVLPAGVPFSTPRAAAAWSTAPTEQLTVTGEYVLNKQDAITEADLFRANSAAFVALFGVAWDAEHWAYSISERMTGPGRYSGRNHLNQDFTVTIAQWVPADLDAGNLSQELRTLARQRGMAFASTMVILATPRARVHMFGVAASRKSDDGATEWAFLPLYYADPGDPLFSNGNISLNQGAASLDEGFRHDLPEIAASSSEDPCVVAAAAQYEAAVAACNDSHNVSVRACNTAHAVTGTGCNVAFSNAYNAAHSAWEQSVAMALVMQVICLLLCTAGTGGFGLFFCAAGCLIPTVSAQAACSSIFASAINEAVAVRSACVAAADFTRRNCMMAAAATREDCITAAMNVCTAQVALCH